MKIYLACTAELKNEFNSGLVRPQDIYVLESFYSIADWQKSLLNRFKGFLLDSGAFTFLNSTKSTNKADFERYADSYAEFIKAYKISRYFELDIDKIVGLQETERLRRRIEQRSGMPCIPVWHKYRGKEYFESMCKEYDYVAIGGIVTKEIPRELYERMFPWFINVAHKHNAMIHGLGYTDTKKLHKFRFDSVDSSTWTCGRRYGEAAWFKDGIILRRKAKQKGLKIKDTTSINLFSFNQWVKMQKYAESRL